MRNFFKHKGGNTRRRLNKSEMLNYDINETSQNEFIQYCDRAREDSRESNINNFEVFPMLTTNYQQEQPETFSQSITPGNFKG